SSRNLVRAASSLSNVWRAAMGADVGERRGGPEATGVDAHVQDGDAGARFGEAIAMTVRHAFNECVEPQAPEVVRHLRGHVLMGRSAEQLRNRGVAGTSNCLLTAMTFKALVLASNTGGVR